MFFIDRDRCAGCGVCVDSCPVTAITMYERAALIDPDLCTGCGACREMCRNQAVMHIEIDDTAARPPAEPDHAYSPAVDQKKVKTPFGAALGTIVSILVKGAELGIDHYQSAGGSGKGCGKKGNRGRGCRRGR